MFILYLIKSVDCHSFSIQSHRKVLYSLFKPFAIIIGASLFCLDCPVSHKHISLDGAVASNCSGWLMTMTGSLTERFPQLFWHIRKSKQHYSPLHLQHSEHMHHWTIANDWTLLWSVSSIIDLLPVFQTEAGAIVLGVSRDIRIIHIYRYHIGCKRQ
jgi:hypothetical protein